LRELQDQRKQKKTKELNLSAEISAQIHVLGNSTDENFTLKTGKNYIKSFVFSELQAFSGEFRAID